MQLAHWRITGLELFLTLVFLVFEFYFGWPSSHLFTWIMAVCTVVGALLFVFPWIFGLPTALFVLLLGLAITYFLPPMPPAESETHGWLIPANEPTPPNACSNFGPVPDDALLIVVGSEAVWTRAKHRPILAIGGHNMLSFTRENNGIALDADFFANTGDLVARIESTTTPNEFHLVPPEYSYSKRLDRSSLEVYDRQGNSLFDVRYVNPHTLSIKGTFYSREPGKVQIVITNDAMVVNSPSIRNLVSSGNCEGAMPASEFAIYSF